MTCILYLSWENRSDLQYAEALAAMALVDRVSSSWAERVDEEAMFGREIRRSDEYLENQVVQKERRKNR